MEVVGTPALVSCHRPTSQVLVGGTIGLRDVQMPIGIDHHLRFRLVLRRGRIQLPMCSNGYHDRYSREADTDNIDGPHDSVLPADRTMRSLRSHLSDRG